MKKIDEKTIEYIEVIPEKQTPVQKTLDTLLSEKTSIERSILEMQKRKVEVPKECDKQIVLLEESLTDIENKIQQARDLGIKTIKEIQDEEEEVRLNNRLNNK